MELTHNYKRQDTFSSLRALLTQRIVRFVTNNPDVFEAIARTGAPFGGSASLLPTRRPVDLQPTQTTQAELAQIQAQLQALTQQVAQLHTVLGEEQRTRQEQSVEKTRKATAGKLIGIDRFRALQGTSHRMA
ncbi:hypothetical protein [Fibrella forsythiae]|uniref:Uncharacterized protein n=1 Tax=Fibrella forsythiae TaxID=2817061 RepID=A0ABS3JJR5_9BACT|nr:hypothetical protein [Fibrella forsythiae]MBO0949142.1 hypothetical protein [Fibrella forsythiae]